jgi:hypothetical protein
MTETHDDSSFLCPGPCLGISTTRTVRGIRHDRSSLPASLNSCVDRNCPQSNSLLQQSLR